MGIVNKRVMLKILLNSLLIGVVVFWQYEKNFLGVEMTKVKTSAFALFTFLQIFNSFNCKELGIESIFGKLFSNKLMVWAMTLALGLQVLLTEFVGGFMGTPLGLTVWLKITGISLSVIIFSEIYKLTLRIIRGNIQNLQKNSLNRVLEKGAK